MEDVGQDCEGEVAACGVPAEGDAGGGDVEVGHEVMEQRNGFAELGWVGGVRGEGVGEHEDGEGGSGGGAGEGGGEGDVEGVGGEVIAAA